MHGPFYVSKTSSDEFDEDPNVARYDVSIFDLKFAALPNPKRVWLGSPASSVEGIGNVYLSTGTIGLAF
jgi:hypothetical protein